MQSPNHGVLTKFLAIGAITLCVSCPNLVAQDTTKKDDVKDRLVGIGTSDGLTLNAYWFQGNAIDKQVPDAVLMFPAPGSKVNDAWISLAKALSAKNFSVLLFDWRGCGLNAADTAGSRIFEDKDQFWRESYNGRLLSQRKTRLEDKGLDWKTVSTMHDSRTRYRDFALMNDLLAARFYLDKQNDAKKCNTNRIWVVSEKDGAHNGMAFIAAEFQRNSIFDPKINRFDRVSGFRSAGKDYVGLIAMSYLANGPSSPTATMVARNALAASGSEAKTHLENRLAMVLMHTNVEGPNASKALVSAVGVDDDLEEMKKRYKYTKEFDVKLAKAPPVGIELIDLADTFKAKDYVIDAMVRISRAQPFGKEPTDRDASKMVVVPRFQIEQFNRR